MCPYISFDTPAKKDLLEHGWARQPRRQEMLYDHYFDPDQQHDLSGRSELAQTQQQLQRELDEWMEATDDPLRRAPVHLPRGVQATHPDACSPGQEPLLVGGMGAHNKS